MTYENIEDFRYWDWVSEYPRDHGVLGLLSNYRWFRQARRFVSRGPRYHHND